MRIDIFTFHLQLNYGGVLQCLVLQTVFENFGRDVLLWICGRNHLIG